MPIDLSIEKVDIYLEAKDLPKLHTFNNTDGFAVVYTVDKLTGAMTKVGTTEVIQNERSPHWSTCFHLDYMFEIVQEVAVRIYHQRDARPIADEAHHEKIGEVRFEVGRLMRANAQRLQFPVQGASEASLSIRAEAVANTRDVLCFTIACNKLTNKDGFFGTSDPFFTISRCNEDSSFTVVYTSTKIDNTLSPRWGEIKLKMSELCNNDLHRPLVIELWDWDSNGKHDSMGTVRTSVTSLLSANGAPFEVHEKKGGKGTLTATNVNVEHHPTFAEFIASGLEMSLTVAVDYTGSNGDPAMTGSLHYIDPTHHSLNAYQQAILSVGGIVDVYDSDHKYNLVGFGARVRDAKGEFGTVSHHIPLGEGDLSAIQALYEDSLSKLKYTVLLILTDGTINDMDETIAELIAASALPMSVIVIGLGDADFEDMQALDSDKGLLKRAGKVAERDIVQFVAMKHNLARGMAVVAQQVLAEVPTQLLQYMEKRGILPHQVRK